MPAKNDVILERCLFKKKKVKVTEEVISANQEVKIKLQDAIKNIIKGLPLWLGGRESSCQCRRHGFNP